MSIAGCRSLSLLLLLLAVGGCGPSKPSFDYEGDWMGNRNLPPSPEMTETVRYTAGRVTLKVQGNKFEKTEAGIPTGGEVTYRTGYIELRTNSFMKLPLEAQGKDADKMHPVITVTPQPDGTLLLDDPRSVDGKAVKLERQSPPG